MSYQEEPSDQVMGVPVQLKRAEKIAFENAVLGATERDYFTQEDSGSKGEVVSYQEEPLDHPEPFCSCGTKISNPERDFSLCANPDCYQVICEVCAKYCEDCRDFVCEKCWRRDPESTDQVEYGRCVICETREPAHSREN